MDWVRKTLILGGARSGKTTHGEIFARESERKLLYLATASSHDEEMKQRIKERDGAKWETLAEPLNIPALIRDSKYSGYCIMIDSLSMWVSNLMDEGKDIAASIEELAQAINDSPAQLVMISNEVGMGVGRDNPAHREYRDHVGRLHQRLGKVCDDVILMVAGIAQHIKGTGTGTVFSSSNSTR